MIANHRNRVSGSGAVLRPDFGDDYPNVVEAQLDQLLVAYGPSVLDCPEI